ncbi:unnamed protein product [Cylicostephanus goldi]|uniref:Uncharacterized protein n=1 Tax=Cylicostephanus goldi TaxID=71465 RepID=A0A3P7NQA8_CYLGO|nr:unnamed protein product [Cylicostephanus goldi]
MVVEVVLVVRGGGDGGLVVPGDGNGNYGECVLVVMVMMVVDGGGSSFGSAWCDRVLVVCGDGGGIIMVVYGSDGSGGSVGSALVVMMSTVLNGDDSCGALIWWSLPLPQVTFHIYFRESAVLELSE